MDVRKLKLDDLKRLPEGLERNLYTGIIRQNLGPALVIEDEEGIVCFFGAVFIWPGVAEVWFKLVRVSHLKELIRRLRWLIEKAAKEFKLWRMQACVEVGFEKGIRFAEFLGFEKEAILRKHNYNGKDNIMYARLF